MDEIISIWEAYQNNKAAIFSPLPGTAELMTTTEEQLHEFEKSHALNFEDRTHLEDDIMGRREYECERIGFYYGFIAAIRLMERSSTNATS